MLLAIVTALITLGMGSKNSQIHYGKISTPAAFREGLPPARPPEVLLQAGGGSQGHDLVATERRGGKVKGKGE